jgi:hypothetical protein
LSDPKPSPAVRYPKPFTDNLTTLDSSRNLSIVLEYTEHCRVVSNALSAVVLELKQHSITGPELEAAKRAAHLAEQEWDRAQQLLTSSVREQSVQEHRRALRLVSP